MFYLDDNPLGVKSGSSIFTTNTLITGSRIKVESFNAQGCSSFCRDRGSDVNNPIISLTSTAYASSASSSTFCEGILLPLLCYLYLCDISLYFFYREDLPQLVTTTNAFTPAPICLCHVCDGRNLGEDLSATETLDMYFVIASSGNIGQASATVCVGEIPPAFTNIASATGVGEITYEWQSRTYGTNFGNVTASATTQVYTPTTAVFCTFFRRVAI